MTNVLCGVNWFGVKARLDELTSSFISEHGDLALERLDGEEVTYEQILGAVESLPFLAAKKMVVVYNLSANKQASENLETLIEKAGDSTDLLIVESKLDKRGVYYKGIKKLKGFEEFNELDEYGLTDWLIKQAEKSGAKLSKSDARYLVERAGSSQAALAHELEKLIQYNPEIARANIELLVNEVPTSTVFNLIDKAFAGDLKAALRIYDEQRAQKVEPQAMLAMLVWQMHVVALCSAAGQKNSSEIASETSLNSFVVGKSQAIAQKMGRTKINKFLELLRDIDYTSKWQTYNYDEAMRFAIVSLAN